MLNLNMDRSSTSPVQSLIEETISEEELGDEIVIKEQDRQHEQHKQQEQQEQSSQQGEQQQHQQCPATENIASNMKSNECVFIFFIYFNHIKVCFPIRLPFH